jgi:predicted Zn finger-like uncharacterized protein
MATFTCPGCGAEYRLPEGAAGKKVRCHKCNHISRVPEDTVLLPQDDGPIPIADEPDDFMAEAAAAAARGHAGAPAPLATPHTSEEADGYVRTGRIPDQRGAGRTFWGDVGWSFCLLAQPGNMATFFIVWMIYLFAAASLWIPAFGRFWCVVGALQLLLNGWIMSFLLNCAAEAAAGEDDLPNMQISDGIVEDILIPIIKFLFASLLVLAPAALFMLAVGIVENDVRGTLELAADPATGWEALETAVLVPFLLLLVMGVFLWPITILVLALGSVADAFRIDLIVRTVIGSFLPYLAVCLLVGAAVVAESLIETYFTGTGAGAVKLGPIAAKLLILGLVAYFEIVTMRIIGLYYRHYKHRFAWEWE